MAKTPHLAGRNRSGRFWQTLTVLAIFVAGMALLGQSFDSGTSAAPGTDDAPNSNPDVPAPAATN